MSTREKLTWTSRVKSSLCFKQSAPPVTKQHLKTHLFSYIFVCIIKNRQMKINEGERHAVKVCCCPQSWALLLFFTQLQINASPWTLLRMFLFLFTRADGTLYQCVRFEHKTALKLRHRITGVDSPAFSGDSYFHNQFICPLFSCKIPNMISQTSGGVFKCLFFSDNPKMNNIFSLLFYMTKKNSKSALIKLKLENVDVNIH